MNKREFQAQILKVVGIEVPVLGDVVTLDDPPGQYVLVGFEDGLPGWAQVIPEHIFRQAEAQNLPVTVGSATWAYLPVLRKAWEETTKLLADPARMAKVSADRDALLGDRG